MQEASAPAGYHDIAIDGQDQAGHRLPSGVYFYRVESYRSESTGRIEIVR